MANINDFKSTMLGGGARPNQFRVELTFPSYVSLGAVAGQQAQFMCKAAELPTSLVEDIQVMYRGRQVHFAGERMFTPWNIQVYTDTNFNVRNALEQWQAGLQNYASTNGKVNPREYQIDLAVHQLDRNGASVKVYKFVDAYPTRIGAIALDYDAGNQLELFDVEFTYNYFISNSTDSGPGGFGFNISVDTPVGNFPLS